MTMTAGDLREMTARGEGPLAKAHPDEPVFLLRAQDNLAADLVDTWAIQAGLLIETTGSADFGHKVQEAKMIAELMRNWPVRKNPD
jgi:hypothetical protein